MVVDFENDVALTGEDRLSELAYLERESLVFKQLRQGTGLILTQIASLGRGGTIAEGFCQLAEVAARVQTGLNVVHFGFGCG